MWQQQDESLESWLYLFVICEESDPATLGTTWHLPLFFFFSWNCMWMWVYVSVWRINLKCFDKKKKSRGDTHCPWQQGLAVWREKKKKEVWSVRCKCGTKHLFTATVGITLIWGIHIRTEGGSKDGQWGNETKWERTRKEMERWPEKTCGSLHRCPKWSHLSSPSPSLHMAKGQTPARR